MLANRVHETTTTTGTGNITLAGAVANMRTFSSQFATSQRFSYFIDDEAGNFENGIGYLSDSVTLVRETVLDSSNAGALVSFGAGAKQVFCAPGAVEFPPLIYPLSTVGFNRFRSAHITYGGGSHTCTLNADRTYLNPFVWNVVGVIKRLVVTFGSTVSATERVRVGLYRVDSNDEIKKIVETPDITPTANTIVKTTISDLILPPGRYFTGIICDEGITEIRGVPGSEIGLSGLGVYDNGTTLACVHTAYSLANPGWVSLPDTFNQNWVWTGGSVFPVVEVEAESY